MFHASVHWLKTSVELYNFAFDPTTPTIITMAQPDKDSQDHVTPGGPVDDEAGEVMSVASSDGEGDDITMAVGDFGDDNNDSSKNRNSQKNQNNDSMSVIDDIPPPGMGDDMIDGNIIQDEGIDDEAEADFVPPKGNLQQFLKTNAKFKQKPDKKSNVAVGNGLDMNMNNSSSNNDSDVLDDMHNEMIDSHMETLGSMPSNVAQMDGLNSNEKISVSPNLKIMSSEGLETVTGMNDDNNGSNDNNNISGIDPPRKGSKSQKRGSKKKGRLCKETENDFDKNGNRNHKTPDIDMGVVNDIIASNPSNRSLYVDDDIDNANDSNENEEAYPGRDIREQYIQTAIGDAQDVLDVAQYEIFNEMNKNDPQSDPQNDKNINQKKSNEKNKKQEKRESKKNEKKEIDIGDGPLPMSQVMQVRVYDTYVLLFCFGVFCFFWIQKEVFQIK